MLRSFVFLILSPSPPSTPPLLPVYTRSGRPCARGRRRDAPGLSSRLSFLPFLRRARSTLVSLLESTAYFLGTYDHPRVVLFCLAAWAGAERTQGPSPFADYSASFSPSLLLRLALSFSSSSMYLCLVHARVLLVLVSLVSLFLSTGQWPRLCRRFDIANSLPVRCREVPCRNGETREIEGFVAFRGESRIENLG